MPSLVHPVYQGIVVPEKETWKSVRGFKGWYEVSTWGKVRSLDRTVVFKDRQVRKYPGKVLAGGLDQDGYRSLILCKNGRRKDYKVHSLVLETFVGKCPKEMECCHLDDNPGNNRLENLCWATHAENIRQRNERKRTVHGTRQHLAKLTEEMIPKIHLDYESGMTAEEIANSLGVNTSTIVDVLRGRTWKHCQPAKLATMRHGYPKNWLPAAIASGRAKTVNLTTEQMKQLQAIE